MSLAPNIYFFALSKCIVKAQKVLLPPQVPNKSPKTLHNTNSNSYEYILGHRALSLLSVRQIPVNHWRCEMFPVCTHSLIHLVKGTAQNVPLEQSRVPWEHVGHAASRDDAHMCNIDSFVTTEVPTNEPFTPFFSPAKSRSLLCVKANTLGISLNNFLPSTLVDCSSNPSKVSKRAA